MAECCCCYSRASEMVEPLVLPCSHLVCKLCLEQQLAKSANNSIKCTCRSVWSGDSLSSLQPYVTGMLPELENSAPSCDVEIACDSCKSSHVAAIIYCQECQLKLCTDHAEKHNELFLTHDCVPIIEYRVKKWMHEIKPCAAHTSKLLELACELCHETFCIVCLSSKTSCSKDPGRPHVAKSIVELTEVMKETLASYSHKLFEERKKDLAVVKELEHSLQDLLTRCDDMKMKVRQTAEDVIKQVKEEERKLLKEINNYQESESDRALCLSIEIENHATLCTEVASKLERLYKKSSIYHLLISYSSSLTKSKELVDSEMDKDLDLDIKHLSEDSSKCLRFSLKSEAKKTTTPDALVYLGKCLDQRMFSVKSISSDTVVCGTNIGIQIRNQSDLELAPIRRFHPGENCYCYALPISDGVLALILNKRNQNRRKYQVMAFSSDLQPQSSILSGNTNFDSTQLTVSGDKKIYVLNRDRRSIDAYTFNGERLMQIDLAQNSSPRHIHAGKHGLLVVDGYGHVYCYKIDCDTPMLLWTSNAVAKPAAVTSDDTFIYVVTVDGKSILVLSPLGELKTTLEVPPHDGTDRHTKLVDGVRDIDIHNGRVALACGFNGLTIYSMTYS